MTKTKKIVIGIIAGIAGFLLLAYLLLGFTNEKPGMDGFTVTNGMFRMLVTGKDYLRVGKDRYIFKDDGIKEIIINEYDSYGFIEGFHPDESTLAEMDVSTILKTVLVKRGEAEYKGAFNGVWTGYVDGFCTVYYAPYDEG